MKDAPCPGTVAVTAAESPLSTFSIDNFGDVVLGMHEDGTPIVHVSLGTVAGQTCISTMHEFTDAALVEDLASALAAAADHLRNAAE